MTRVKILRDGPIADPTNPRLRATHVKAGDEVDLPDAAAKMAVEESKPPRAEYLDDEPEPEDEGGGSESEEDKSRDGGEKPREGKSGRGGLFGGRGRGKGEDKPGVLE